MNKILLIYFQGDKDGKVRIILFVHTVGVWHLSSIWMLFLAGQRDIKYRIRKHCPLFLKPLMNLVLGTFCWTIIVILKLFNITQRALGTK